MPTDKLGVMTFLNPELYKRLVAFKETQRLRSLSHAVELALGEYFGVAIAPITRSQAAPPAAQRLWARPVTTVATVLTESRFHQPDPQV